MHPKPGLQHFLPAILLSIIMLIPYEYYWRVIREWPRGYDDNAERWATWRRAVDHLSDQDIVIIGSSRANFDLNVHLFDSAVGRRPVMLATPGGSPYYVLEDVVRQSDFKGLIILSVAPGLFYSTGTSGSTMWIKNERVDFTRKQTYASRFCQSVYQLVDSCFSYLDTDIALRNLVDRLPFKDRDSVRHNVVWPPMVSFDRYRSVRMSEGMETDTTLQGQQTKIWSGFGFRNENPDSAASIIHHYVSNIKAFLERGGRVAIIRPPVTGEYLKHEPVLFPRETYWDVLVHQAGVPGYHFQDYPAMATMRPPEWSHLNRKEADEYTRLIITLLKQDGLL